MPQPQEREQRRRGRDETACAAPQGAVPSEKVRPTTSGSASARASSSSSPMRLSSAHLPDAVASPHRRKQRVASDRGEIEDRRQIAAAAYDALLEASSKNAEGPLEHDSLAFPFMSAVPSKQEQDGVDAAVGLDCVGGFAQIEAQPTTAPCEPAAKKTQKRIEFCCVCHETRQSYRIHVASVGLSLAVGITTGSLPRQWLHSKFPHCDRCYQLLQKPINAAFISACELIFMEPATLLSDKLARQIDVDLEAIEAMSILYKTDRACVSLALSKLHTQQSDCLFLPGFPGDTFRVSMLHGDSKHSEQAKLLGVNTQGGGLVDLRDLVAKRLITVNFQRLSLCAGNGDRMVGVDARLAAIRAVAERQVQQVRAKLSEEKNARESSDSTAAEVRHMHLRMPEVDLK